MQRKSQQRGCKPQKPERRVTCFVCGPLKMSPDPNGVRRRSEQGGTSGKNRNKTIKRMNLQRGMEGNHDFQAGKKTEARGSFKSGDPPGRGRSQVFEEAATPEQPVSATMATGTTAARDVKKLKINRRKGGPSWKQRILLRSSLI